MLSANQKRWPMRKRNWFFDLKTRLSISSQLCWRFSAIKCALLSFSSVLLLSGAVVAASDSLAPLFENDSLSSKRKESLGSRYLNDIIEFWIFLIEFVQIFLVSIFICSNNKIHFKVWRLISTIGQHIISNSASNFEILQPRFDKEKVLYSVSKSEKSKIAGIKMAVFRRIGRSITESDDFAWARPAI